MTSLTSIIVTLLLWCAFVHGLKHEQIVFEQLLFAQGNETQDIFSALPLQYPRSSCVGELFFTPSLSWSDPFNKFWWSDFNLVAFGDVLHTEQDISLEHGVKVAGRVAVMGDLLMRTEGSFGHNILDPGERPYTIIAGHNFDFFGGNIHPKEEGVFVGGHILTPARTPDYIQKNIRGKCHSFLSKFCLDLTFDKGYWYYKMVSKFWMYHPTNAINELRTEWSGVTLIMTAAVPHQPRYYINIKKETFQAATNFELFGFPDTAEFIVNIEAQGDMAIHKKGKWPSLVGVFPGRVVFNIPTEGTISIQDSRLPSVLAVDATINQQSGRIEGFLIAKKVDQLGVIHNVDCRLTSQIDARKRLAKWVL